MLIATLAFLFTACKKEDNGTAPSSIAGTWQGKWGDGNQTPVNFIKFVIKSNGTLERLNEQNEVIANGSWTVSGVEFECTYTHTAAAGGQTHKIAGLYTDFEGVITGTWGYNPSKANGGTVDLTKQ